MSWSLWICPWGRSFPIYVFCERDNRTITTHRLPGALEGQTLTALTKLDQLGRGTRKPGPVQALLVRRSRLPLWNVGRSTYLCGRSHTLPLCVSESANTDAQCSRLPEGLHSLSLQPGLPPTVWLSQAERLAASHGTSSPEQGRLTKPSCLEQASGGQMSPPRKRLGAICSVRSRDPDGREIISSESGY
jgi:hypothetical protein